MSKATKEEAESFASMFEIQPTTPVEYDSPIGVWMRANINDMVKPWRGWYFIIGSTEEEFRTKVNVDKREVYP